MPPWDNQIGLVALRRSNWLFAGSLRAGKRAAAIMSLVHSANINGHDPCAYLKDLLQRLLTQPASRVEELMPHRWQPLTAPLRGRLAPVFGALVRRHLDQLVQRLRRTLTMFGVCWRKTS